MPPMDRAPKSAWGQRPPGVGGANGAPPGRGDGGKRQTKDPVGANMGARKPHDGPGRRGASKNDGYSEELYTTKLDMSKFTPEQIKQAEITAAQIERENKSGKISRKMGEYEDAEDASEVPQQSAPPPPANNASTFPALGSAAGISAAEPVPVASHNASKVPSQSGPQQPPPSDPAVLQMGPTAVPHNNPAGTGEQHTGVSGSKSAQEEKSSQPVTAGPPMGGQVQFPPGMQNMMRGPGPGMPSPSHMLQPAQAGAAGWQGGNMNNQPPTSGMGGAGAVAGSDGPGGMPSDPMMQMQAQSQMNMMMQQIMQLQHHMAMQRETIERLEREKNDHYRGLSPGDEVKELVQKKEALRVEISNMEQHRNVMQHQMNMMQMNMMQMRMQHPGQMDKGSGTPLPGAPDAGMMNPMGMGGMHMDPMMAQHMMMQHMMMQQQMQGHPMQQMQGHPMQQQQQQQQPPPPQQQQQQQPQQPQMPQQQQQLHQQAPPTAQTAPQSGLSTTPSAEAPQSVAAPAAAIAPKAIVTTSETVTPPQTVAEQIVSASAPGPSSITAPARAAPAAPIAHTNGTPDAAPFVQQPQPAPQPQATAPQQSQARAGGKGSASEAETLQNLKRQLLHLKKTTEHREYFNLDNMTIPQLESTIKRVQEANGLSSVANNERATRGRGRGSGINDTGSRPGDEWEVVAPTKKGAMRSNADEKKIHTFRARDRNGMTDNILNGLFMFPDFLSVQEENQLLNFVNDQLAKGARRELQGNTYHKDKTISAQLHYGVFYNMSENSPGSKQVEPMPEELNRFITKLISEGILTQKQRPNTAVICVLEEGDGMMPRVDSKEFARPLCTLSLLSDGDMIFGDKSGQIEAPNIDNMDGYALIIPRRSVIRLDDLVANDVQHAISPAKCKRIVITFRQQVAIMFLPVTLMSSDKTEINVLRSCWPALHS